MSELIQVVILGRQRTVTLPDFAAREEIAAAYGEALKRGGIALLRVYAAGIGLCTGAARDSGASYAKHRFDLLSYGGEVYGWLREQGMSPKEIATVGVTIVETVSTALFPRKSELEEAAGNSAGNAET